MEKLLLHVCCAPCSTIALERLYGKYDISLLFYNPNISSFDEFEKRYNELVRFISDKKYDINIIKIDYDSEPFYDLAKGLESSPEGSERCFKCYDQRMKFTSEYAGKNGFSCFDTTLSTSPHKNFEYIKEIGQKLAKEFKIIYLENNFKKEEGFKRSIEISKEFNLYRQNYCGCIYSKRD